MEKKIYIGIKKSPIRSVNNYNRIYKERDGYFLSCGFGKCLRLTYKQIEEMLRNGDIREFKPKTND